MHNDIAVSVIIRTKNRPTLLRQALISLSNQTYRNFEIIVVEDGQVCSKEIIDEFKYHRINYYFANCDVGRSKIGNIGLSLANAEYINFLDDDDFLLPNHLETLISFAKNRTEYLFHTDSYEYLVKYISKDPLVYRILCKRRIRYKKIDYFFLHYINLFPIQSVLFHRSLYEKYGGFDEDLDLLEDWDLWLRYIAMVGYRAVYIGQVTSVYTIDVQQKNRNSKLRKYLSVFYQRNIPLTKLNGIEFLFLKMKLFGLDNLFVKFYKKLIIYFYKLRY